MTYGFYPTAQQSVFVPDQLIGGELKLVTHTDTFAGGQGVLVRGTVMGYATTGANANTWVVSTTAATDGSQVPSAILVDQVDTTAGPITGGLYLMGEFNADYLTYGTGWTPTALFYALRPFCIFVKLQPVLGDIV